jgi:aspartyl-tRNA(Asn)/glutamyl-tRNA(Gln) amidotransferase subunit A
VTLPADPLESFGLRKFGERLRSGEMTAEAVTRAYCARIQLRDPKIGAFKTIVAEQAIEAARGIDALLRAGTDLGPLMGLPIAVKEIFSIDGLPYGAGSDLDLSGMTPPQGPFIDRIKRAGCVILGTTRTTEFAGATINVNKPMPWNPADEEVKRVCGGSSHGSAAALAAGLCAFSVGSDTGGSVRLPAALCGVFGFKTTAQGEWPTQGVFALSPTLDSVGVFTHSADDAALIFATLSERAAEDEVPRPRTLRFGRPKTYAFDELEDPVRRAVELALDKLRESGVEIVDVEIPDIQSAMPPFAQLLFSEFVASFGKDRLQAGQSTIDPVVWNRIAANMNTAAEVLTAAQRAHRSMTKIANDMMEGVDALVYPTTPFVACPVSEVRTLEAALAWNLRSGRLTRPGNFFGQCGVSIPVQPRGQLPVGLQVICKGGADSRLLAISRAVENIVRPLRQPTVQ